MKYRRVVRARSEARGGKGGSRDSALWALRWLLQFGDADERAVTILARREARRRPGGRVSEKRRHQRRQVRPLRGEGGGRRKGRAESRGLRDLFPPKGTVVV